MTTISYSSITILTNLLNDNWTSPPLPEISTIWDKRTIAFIDDRRDQIIITPRNENITYYGLHGDDHLHEILLDLDIRTYQDIDRHSDIVSEVLNIIKDNIRGGDVYMDLRILSSASRSDKVRNMFNHIITVTYRIVNP